MSFPFPVRVECPPGACICERDLLLADPQADVRVLMLTRQEEKRLVERLERLASYEDLKNMQERMRAQLGLVLHIVPSERGVRTVRGLAIRIEPRAGLCRLTRQSIPAAIRRALEQKPDIVYALLNAHDLLSDT
jgi:hypothetical protein